MNKRRIETPLRCWEFIHRYRFGVCRTPRCGSTTIAEWLLKVRDGHPRQFPFDGEWLTDAQFDRIMSEYRTLLLVRDPFSRMVSAYLGKIVKHQNLINAQRLIEAVQGICGVARDHATGVTFRQFVWAATIFVDDHWRPIVEFSPGEPTHYCTPEHMPTYIKTISERLEIPVIPLGRENATPYGAFMAGAADMAPADLRQLSGYPTWESFYDRELRALVGQVYSDDIKRFYRAWTPEVSNAKGDRGGIIGRADLGASNGAGDQR